ncbi:ABC-type sugar transport system, periplasmic component [Devosia sp. LC5]|uniref:ABC transporter substrate-binding protein n=1 Tax=Devosia sp. LC5 TaxID=1502724 RepID=UPI0004E402CD|nr:ABC transporter substrate-binding protein [Devosia sp. LC5]KFC66683.1 ABC-type sugar transport system, periplasmic component [Devosia sp. LC5]
MRLLLPSLTALLLVSTAQAQDLTAEVAHSWTSGGEAAAVKVISDAFTARGGTWVDWSVAGFESANAAYISRLLAGDPPTAKTAVAGPEVTELIAQGLMNDIDTAFHAAVPDGVVPQVVLDAITMDGKVYMAPTGMHAGSWMFYSMPVFEKAGITEAPTSWDEFFAAMDKIKAAGLVPIAWGGQSWQEGIVFHAVVLSTIGAEAFTKLYKDSDLSVIDTPEFAEAVNVFGRMRDYVDAGAPGRNWNDATAMVIRDEAGVQLLSDFIKGEFTTAGETPGIDYGCALTPSTDSLIFLADAFTFPKTGNADEDKAQALLAEAVLDPRVQADFSALKGSLPIRTDVDTSGLDACAQTAIELVKQDKIVPDAAMTLSPAINGGFKDAVGAFFADPAMTSEAFIEQYKAAFANG